MTSPKMAAFLQMVRWSELGPSLITVSDQGYNVLVGSTAQKPLLFDSYDTHPNIYNATFDSTAAGAYQINHPTWLDGCKVTGLTDFSPATQDALAEWLVGRCGATIDVEAGNLTAAVARAAGTWASLPGGSSGQHEQPYAALQGIYEAAGGALA